tara:strand:- start:16396 stop:18471 length:2076 start_codon:yes stop_codon:yes gene_type:complete
MLEKISEKTEFIEKYIKRLKNSNNSIKEHIIKEKKEIEEKTCSSSLTDKNKIHPSFVSNGSNLEVIKKIAETSIYPYNHCVERLHTLVRDCWPKHGEILTQDEGCYGCFKSLDKMVDTWTKSNGSCICKRNLYEGFSPKRSDSKDYLSDNDKYERKTAILGDYINLFILYNPELENWGLILKPDIAEIAYSFFLPNGNDTKREKYMKYKNLYEHLARYRYWIASTKEAEEVGDELNDGGCSIYRKLLIVDWMETDIKNMKLAKEKKEKFREHFLKQWGIVMRASLKWNQLYQNFDYRMVQLGGEWNGIKMNHLNDLKKYIINTTEDLLNAVEIEHVNLFSNMVEETIKHKHFNCYLGRLKIKDFIDNKLPEEKEYIDYEFSTSSLKKILSNYTNLLVKLQIKYSFKNKLDQTDHISPKIYPNYYYTNNNPERINVKTFYKAIRSPFIEEFYKRENSYTWNNMKRGTFDELFYKEADIDKSPVINLRIPFFIDSQEILYKIDKSFYENIFFRLNEYVDEYPNNKEIFKDKKIQLTNQSPSYLEKSIGIYTWSNYRTTQRIIMDSSRDLDSSRDSSKIKKKENNTTLKLLRKKYNQVRKHLRKGKIIFKLGDRIDNKDIAVKINKKREKRIAQLALRKEKGRRSGAFVLLNHHPMNGSEAKRPLNKKLRVIKKYNIVNPVRDIVQDGNIFYVD